MRLLCTNCWGGVVSHHRAKAGHRVCDDCARTAAPTCPYCSRDLEGSEIDAKLCSSDDCPRHDSVTLAMVADLDPELAQADPEAAAAAGRYLAQSMRRGVSDVWRTGGREMYRNRRGRCEDAPCCGCCNA